MLINVLGCKMCFIFQILQIESKLWFPYFVFVTVTKVYFPTIRPPFQLFQVENSDTVIGRLYGQCLHGSQARPNNTVGPYT